MFYVLPFAEKISKTKAISCKSLNGWEAGQALFTEHASPLFFLEKYKSEKKARTVVGRKIIETNLC